MRVNPFLRTLWMLLVLMICDVCKNRVNTLCVLENNLYFYFANFGLRVIYSNIGSRQHDKNA